MRPAAASHACTAERHCGPDPDRAELLQPSRPVMSRCDHPTTTPRPNPQTAQEESRMTLKSRLQASVAAIGLAGFLTLAPLPVQAQTAVAIDNDDIGGVVTGPNGPEAGVWVIAETTDLPTR